MKRLMCLGAWDSFTSFLPLLVGRGAVSTTCNAFKGLSCIIKATGLLRLIERLPISKTITLKLKPTNTSPVDQPLVHLLCTGVSQHGGFMVSK